MDISHYYKYLHKSWLEAIPTLQEFIRIPNQSPDFDDSNEGLRLAENAMNLIVDWINAQAIEGLVTETVLSMTKSPILFCTLEATDDKMDSILFYQHLDKQPPLTDQWSEGLGPYDPIIKNGKLYGRGSVDDGYAIFVTIILLKALKKFNLPHGRIVVLLEASEESGSCDLNYHLTNAEYLIGKPDIVFCLDGGGHSFDELWLTTSLRGCFLGELEVEVLEKGVHSGDAGGIVPQPFQLMVDILSRVYDFQTDTVTLESLHTTIPEEQMEAAEETVSILDKEGILGRFPCKKRMVFNGDLVDYYLRNTWSPTMTIIGLDGLPSVAEGGNLIHPNIKAKLSVRLPPTKDPAAAMSELKEALERDPPLNAKVTFTPGLNCSGWAALNMKKELMDKITEGSELFFGNSPKLIGEGASVPIINLLSQKFPDAQMVVTGAIGPGSNIHGPDECLDLDMASKLIRCLGHIIKN